MALLATAGRATGAALSSPVGVAVDSAGSLYFASRNRIRKVDTAGTITTIAGDGTAGFSGDSGPATAARLDNPLGVAVDGAGSLYIVDEDNNRIRKIDTAGTITTIAGDGTAAFGGDGGLAIAAQLNSPSDVAADSAGNVYIADTGNQRIRKVDTAGTITTIAGDGTAGFNGDGGPATDAQLSNPLGVAAGSTGSVYIADTFNLRIRKVDTAGTITTIAGDGTFGFSGDGGPATDAQLNVPIGLAVDSDGKVYIADAFNSLIRLLTSVVAPSPAPPPPVPSPPPTVRASPTQLSFTLAQDAEPASSTFTLEAIRGNVKYSIRRGGSWVSAAPDSGNLAENQKATIQARVDPRGLSVGTHQARLFIRARSRIATRVLVTLEVTPAPMPPPSEAEPPEPTKPSVAEGGAVNAASLAPLGSMEHAVAPGSVVAIFGSHFTDGEHFMADSVPLPFSLGGVSVTFNGLPAALYGIWPDQINAQVPWALIDSTSRQALGGPPANRQGASTAALIVENSNGSGDPTVVQINDFSPAIFTISGTGSGQGAVFFAGTADLVAPASFAESSRPAAAGDLLTIYANGLGPVDPPIEDGHNSCVPDSECLPDFSNLTLRTTTTRPTVTIGGVLVPDEDLLFSGLSPLSVALYQVDIRASDGLPSGRALPIVIRIGELQSPADVNIAVE